MESVHSAGSFGNNMAEMTSPHETEYYYAENEDMHDPESLYNFSETELSKAVWKNKISKLNAPPTTPSDDDKHWLEWIGAKIDKIAGDDGTIEINELKNAIGVKKTFFGEQFFHLLDQDDSGRVERGELMDGISRLIIGTPEQKLKLLFDLYETDGSAEIHKDEIHALLHDWSLSLSENALKKLAFELYFWAMVINPLNDMNLTVTEYITFDQLRCAVEEYPGLIEKLNVSVANWLTRPDKANDTQVRFRYFTQNYMRNNLETACFFVYCVVNIILCSVVAFWNREANVWHQIAFACGLCYSFNCIMWVSVSMIRQYKILEFDQDLLFQRMTELTMLGFSIVYMIVYTCNKAVITWLPGDNGDNDDNDEDDKALIMWAGFITMCIIDFLLVMKWIIPLLFKIGHDKMKDYQDRKRSGLTTLTLTSAESTNRGVGEDERLENGSDLCKNKEDKLLDYIRDKFFITVHCNEMQDITKALDEFLRNLCKAFDVLEVPFRIKKLIPGGSVSENARLWDFCQRLETDIGTSFIEFDYLAVLSDSCMQIVDYGRCPGFKVVKDKTNRFADIHHCHCYNTNKDRNMSYHFGEFGDEMRIPLKTRLLDAAAIRVSFTACVRAICEKIATTYNEGMLPDDYELKNREALENSLWFGKLKKYWNEYIRNRSIEPFQFMIDTPSGSLLLDLSDIYDVYNEYALKFTWTSKTQNLQPPQYFQGSVPNTFDIHLDFLPAFEFTDDFNTHNLNSREPRYAARFLVPTVCNIGHRSCWRVSTLIQEQEIIMSASDVHLDAYKLLKFVTRNRRFRSIKSYMKKTVFLNHVKLNQCPSTGESVKGCLHAMLNSLMIMYTNKCVPNFFYKHNLISPTRYSGVGFPKEPVVEDIAYVERLLSNADSVFQEDSPENMLILFENMISYQLFKDEFVLQEGLPFNSEQQDVHNNADCEFKDEFVLQEGLPFNSEQQDVHNNAACEFKDEFVLQEGLPFNSEQQDVHNIVV